jgi:hypothetical protein
MSKEMKYEINWMDKDDKVLCPDQMKECKAECPKAVIDREAGTHACGFAVSVLYQMDGEQRNVEYTEYMKGIHEFHKESRKEESKHVHERDRIDQERWERREHREEMDCNLRDNRKIVEMVMEALKDHSTKNYEAVFKGVMDKLYDNTGKRMKVEDMTFEEYEKENKK